MYININSVPEKKRKHFAIQFIKVRIGLVILLLSVFVGISYGQFPEGKWVSTDQKDCKYFFVNFHKKFKKATWSGACKDGFADGEGQLVIVVKEKYTDTIVYTGTMAMGRITGYGELQYGWRYLKGNFVDARINGKGVLRETVLGEEWEYYEGDFVNGSFDGYGMHKDRFGELYVGEFKSNQFEGKGKLIDRDSTVFEGVFRSGRVYGEQIIRFKDGDSVIGKVYKYDAKYNKAIYKYKDGAEFKGLLHYGNFRPDSGQVFKNNIHIADVVNGVKGPIQKKPVASSDYTSSSQSTLERQDSEFEKEIVLFMKNSKSIVEKCEALETCLQTKVYFDCQSLKYEIKAANPQRTLNECNYIINGYQRRKESIQIERGIQNYYNLEAELMRIRGLLKRAVDR